MHRVRDAVAGVAEFDSFTHADKIRFFIWVLHADGKEHVQASDVTRCYDAINLTQPANIHQQVKTLEKQKDLLPSKQGYRLAKHLRDRLDAKHGSRPVTVQVHELLTKLPASLQSPDYRDYLDEALKCFRVGAWRGAIIMAWCLAFDHLCDYVLADAKRLADFNSITSKWKKPVTISQRSDLQELMESQVVTVCRDAAITDKTQTKCVQRNLGIRNDAAHPSGAKFSQPQAEAFIIEVVQTIVLGLQ
jgi:hypothetical protein